METDGKMMNKKVKKEKRKDTQIVLRKNQEASLGRLGSGEYLHSPNNRMFQEAFFEKIAFKLGPKKMKTSQTQKWVKNEKVK